MSSTSVADDTSSMGSTSPADKSMIKVMAMVLGALVLFALFCVLVARLLGVIGGGESDSQQDAFLRNALIERIEPVGSVRLSADELPASQQAGGDAGGGGEQVASAKTGEELVQGACASCHAAGVAGAPKLDDDAAWAQRREAGLDALVASVINGKNAMPARGGSSYTDEEIKRAVQYIAGFEVDEPPAAGGDEAAAADDSGQNAGGNDAGDEASADEGSAAAEGDGGEQSADAGGGDAGGGNDEQAGAAGDDVDLVALIGSGNAPDGISDQVKTAVDGVCAGCHVSGVANAPKLGDKEAWTPRAETGLAALTASVVNGKGAMPPMGGSQLAEDEVPAAIQYLMSKSGS